MTYSETGYEGISIAMHRFVREHIVRGEWKKKERPVLLNSWEALYFHVNERKIEKLASARAQGKRGLIAVTSEGMKPTADGENFDMMA